MQKRYFVGIDVSKLTLDVCVVLNAKVLKQQTLSNQPKTIEGFVKQICRSNKITPKDILICMEHTGIYNSHLLEYASRMSIAVCLEHPMQIKNSMGLQRTKSDKVDAQRIALYAYKHRETLRLWQPAREVVMRLKDLMGLRRRLLNALNQLKVPAKEMKGFKNKNSVKHLTAFCQHSIKTLQKELTGINKAIKALIKEDAYLNKLFSQVTSIDGVGIITAVEVIITTNEFKNINSAKKFACYAGIAPFEQTSGTSLRVRNRVSHFANKNVKQLLHMAALSAIVMPGELRNYYLRKTKAGKNKMSVINAVRNKLVHRIFACVNQDRLYQKKLRKSLVNP